MGNIDVCGSKSSVKKQKDFFSPAEASRPITVPILLNELIESVPRRIETIDKARASLRLITKTLCPLLATKKTLTIDQLDRLINSLRDADWYLAVAACLVDPELGPKEAFQVVECLQYLSTNLLARVLTQREPDSRWATDLTPLFGGWSLRQTVKSSLASIQEIGKSRFGMDDSSRQLSSSNGTSLGRIGVVARQPEVTSSAGFLSSK